MKQEMRELAAEYGITEYRSRELLHSIHGQIRERRPYMKMMKSKKMVLAAAVLAVLGTGTAMGAGKIAYLSSGHSVNQVDYQTAAEVRKSEKLDGEIKVVEKFSDETVFQKAYSMDVSAWDENGVELGSYPEISVYYSDGLVLSISDPMEGLSEGPEAVILSETYEEIPVEVKSIDYLFLPPDAEVSPEDAALEAEGKLMISYGSAEEQRTTYMGAVWEEDGLKYHLFTMDGDEDAEELFSKAKEIIDVE